MSRTKTKQSVHFDPGDWDRLRALSQRLRVPAARILAECVRRTVPTLERATDGSEIQWTDSLAIPEHPAVEAPQDVP